MTPRRAKRFQDHRVVNPMVMAGRERPAEHQRGGHKRDGAGAANGQHQVGHNTADCLQRLLTRTAVTIGNDSATARIVAASCEGVPPPGYVKVARLECGAPATAFGENTMTKLIPRLSQSTRRMLAMVAVMLRPSTFTVTGSPSLRPSPSAILFSKETSGGPL